MLNLIPASLSVSLKLCTVVALLVACSGCTALKVAGVVGSTALIVIGAHPSSAPVVSNDIVYPQAPYVEPAVPPADTESAKAIIPDPTKQP